MTLERLNALIASGEGETLEVKETTGQRVDACETLCGFLNKDGGTLGGSRSRATENETQVDARERVPPLRGRKRPSKNSVLLTHDNRAIILFVTVVTNLRQTVLDNKMVLDCIIDAWRKADNWLVGRFVIMPDHIHFFCAPSTYPPSSFHSWMAYWKSIATKEYWRTLGGSRSRATENEMHADARERVPPARNPSLFQRDCWDTQLRTGDSYAEKWEYVRNNPVRRGLVDKADAWPYQGEMNVLEWHDR